jgi:hypothetical protein
MTVLIIAVTDSVLRPEPIRRPTDRVATSAAIVTCIVDPHKDEDDVARIEPVSWRPGLEGIFDRALPRSGASNDPDNPTVNCEKWTTKADSPSLVRETDCVGIPWRRLKAADLRLCHDRSHSLASKVLAGNKVPHHSPPQIATEKVTAAIFGKVTRSLIHKSNPYSHLRLSN